MQQQVLFLRQDTFSPKITSGGSNLRVLIAVCCSVVFCAFSCYLSLFLYLLGPVRHCDNLVSEEEACCFVICVLSEVVC